MDRAENLSAVSNTATAVVDTRAPHLVFAAPLDGAKVGKLNQLLATSPDTDIASVQFRIKPAQGGNWADLGPAVLKAPFGMAWDTTDLVFGDYLLQVIGTDKGARTDAAPASIRVILSDVDAPEAVSDLKATVNGGNVELRWSSSASDLASYASERTDSAGVTVNIEVAGGAMGGHTDAELDDNMYQYSVFALDASGNRSPAGAPVNALVYTPAAVQPYTPSDATSFVFERPRADRR